MAVTDDPYSDEFNTVSERPFSRSNRPVVVPREYLELSQQLDLLEVARRILYFTQEISGPATKISLLRWVDPARGFSVLAGLALASGFLEAARFLYANGSYSPLNLTKTVQLSPSEAAVQNLPDPPLPVLAYLPLGQPDFGGKGFQGGLFIFGSDCLTPEQFDRLTQLAELVAPALVNAAEHQQVLTDYRMLETIRQTWDQLWITRDEQQRTLEKMVARNRALHDIGLAINSSLNLKEVLDTIVHETVKVAQTSRGAIAMWDESRRELTVMAEHNLSYSLENPEGTAPVKKELDQLVFTYPAEVADAPVFRPPVPFPNGLSPTAISSLKHFLTGYWQLDPQHPGGIMVRALRWQNQIIGVILLNDLTPGRLFEREDEDIVTLIGSQATIAIENARLFNAMTDERNRTRAILNSITDGVFTTDTAENILTFNPGAQTLTGYSAEELVGKNYLQALQISDRSGHSLAAEISPALQAMQAKTPTEPRIFLIQRGRNQPGTALIALVAAPILDEYGQLSGTVGVFRDVTQEQEVSRLKDEFVSLVSHELRTPMASVLGFSELLLTRQLTESKSRLYVETIHKEALRLSTLINDFLDIQGMEAGRQVYNYVEVDLGQLVSQAIGIFSQQPDRIKLDLPAGLPLVRADPDRILQTLTNLISNALKYSPDGGPVELHNRLAAGGMLELEVKDYGLGIPRESQGHLFEKFYRVDNSDRREIGGTGLGLSICREIIEAHGGKIWLNSELGQGSQFYFTLPTVKKAGEIEGPADNLVLVMVIEAAASMAQLICTHLEEEGFQTVCLSSPAQAARHLTETRRLPELIVLDINQDGGSDNWDFLFQLKSHLLYKAIPVIINSDRNNYLNDQMLGAANLLAKPFDTSRLVELINRLTVNRPQRNLLVIDDDVSLRRVLKESLSAHDFVVGVAAGGEQGLKLAFQNQPDLIILDLMMPKMDGFEVLTRLWGDRRTINIPVIVFSAKELSAQDNQFLQEGLAYFLTKDEYTPRRISEVADKVFKLRKNHESK